MDKICALIDMIFQPKSSDLNTMILSNDIESTRYLFKYNKSTIDIHYCCQYGSLEMLKLYIDYDRDAFVDNVNQKRFDYRNPNVLNVVEESKVGHLLLLLDLVTDLGLTGPDSYLINESVTDVLTRAVINGHIDIVRYCYRRGVHIDTRMVNTSDSTQLMVACLEGQVELVRFFLKHGADVNYINVSGRTPLIEASAANHTDIVRMLLAHSNNINLNIIDDEIDTALSYSITENNLEIFTMLVEYGADIHFGNEKPILLAIRYERIKMAEYLLEHGAIVTDHFIRNDLPLCSSIIQQLVRRYF